MEIESAQEKCPECGGRTVEFSGHGLDTQYKICSRWKEPGHKTEEEVKRILANVRKQLRPSGRFA